MPSTLASLAENFPVTLANTSLREIMLNGSSIAQESGSIVKLVFWALGLLLAGMLKFRLEKK